MIWALIAIVALPVLVGWYLGKSDVDPNTPEGRRYYAAKATPQKEPQQ